MVNFADYSETTGSTILDDPEPTILVAAGSESDERIAAPHQHSRGELFGSVRGLLSVGLKSGVWMVPATNAVWIPPGHVHSARSHGPYKGWAAFVAPSTCADLPAAPCIIRTSPLLQEALLRAATWPLGPHSPAHARIADVILDEIRGSPVEPFGLPLPKDPRLMRIAEALLLDPADSRDLEQWANWGAISSRSLSRRFVSETGFSFTAWRQRARMMRSLELLAAGAPVTSIALDLGYATASAFTNLFRRTFGETPSAYRQRL